MDYMNLVENPAFGFRNSVALDDSRISHAAATPGAMSDTGSGEDLEWP